MATTRKTEVVIEIPEVQEERIEVALLGITPLICHRMAQKAREVIVVGGETKKASERRSTVKHDVIREFRESPDLLPPGSEARIGVMASAVKKAIMTAALDAPGATKSQIGRLVWVEGQLLPVFGIPKLFMAVTRSADINKTPDVRTRAILPEWACVVRVAFVTPLVNQTTIVRLLAMAGVTTGIGDWRPEKGAGNYGQFRVVSSDDPRVMALRETGGYAAQETALIAAEPYDAESAELLSVYLEACRNRGFTITLPGPARAWRD